MKPFQQLISCYRILIVSSFKFQVFPVDLYIVQIWNLSVGDPVNMKLGFEPKMSGKAI